MVLRRKTVKIKHHITMTGYSHRLYNLHTTASYPYRDASVIKAAGKQLGTAWVRCKTTSNV